MMTEEDQAAINDALERNDFTGEAYLKAVDNYMDRYCNYWREDLPSAVQDLRNPVEKLICMDGDRTNSFHPVH